MNMNTLKVNGREALYYCKPTNYIESLAFRHRLSCLSLCLCPCPSLCLRLRKYWGILLVLTASLAALRRRLRRGRPTPTTKPQEPNREGHH
jgi:hypothetical protein